MSEDMEAIYDAMQAGEDDECDLCDGEGFITLECFEDTCCCANPEEEHGWSPRFSWR